MKSIIIDHIMKVIDVDHRNISKATLKYLQNLRPEYIDSRLKEHLYELDEIDEKIQYSEIEPASPSVWKQIQKLLELLHENEASYLRITF